MSEPSKPPKWARDDIEILRRWWKLEPTKKTAARIGRSEKACALIVGTWFGSTVRERWDDEDRWECQVDG